MSYSSDALDTGYPALAQGVFIPDDMNELFRDDDTIRTYLDKTWKEYARKHI